jgi:hypothetical protein
MGFPPLDQAPEVVSKTPPLTLFERNPMWLSIRRKEGLYMILIVTRRRAGV